MKFISHSLLLLLCSSMLPVSAQVRINEVNALNNNGKVNPVSGEPGDWIELYSPVQTVGLGGWFLSDDPENPFKWRFPEPSRIDGQGYLLLWADGSGDTTEHLRPGFRLNVEGECILLTDREGKRVDSLSYPRMYEDHSYGIDAEGSGSFFQVPSPGAWNYSTSAYRVSPAPRLSLAPGVYPSAVSVALLSDGESLIRYTTDGTAPGLNSPVYRNPILISENTVLRTRSWLNGHRESDVVTGTYLVRPVVSLPVVSLVTDPDNLFDNQTGIYVTGTNGIPGYCNEDPHNFNQDWERPVSFEYFDRNGRQQVWVDAGMKIHGGCSRTAPMKSLAIFARGIYGSSSIRHPFFREKPDTDEFEGLILRNGGNDFWFTMLRDGIIQASVSRVMDLDYQAFEQVLVFVNGEYWGIHNLREKVNEHWVKSNYGIPSEEIDFMKNQWHVFAGSRDAWSELDRFLQANSLADEANYQWVAERVDIPSYQDYLITQLFFANRDWPGNNIKYWRSRTEYGKWRWILFDTEFAMGLYDQDPTRNMLEFATENLDDEWPNPRWSTLIIRRLLENPGFRDQFIQKYQAHLNTTFRPERIISVIDSFRNNMADFYPEHAARWGVRDPDSWAEQVELLRVFARERPAWVWKHLRDFFDLGETVQVDILNNDPHGRVRVNGVSLPGEGMKGPWSRGSMMTLHFEADPGYRFSRWEILFSSGTPSILLEKQSEWRYNDSGTYPGGAWKDPGFDDSSWASGRGPLGYGDPFMESTLDYGTNPDNKHITTWFRKEIRVEDPQRYSSMVFRVMRDDGVVVYVNGREAFRDNMPEGEITPETPSVTWAGGEDEYRYFEFPVDASLLAEGSNIIAVELHQVSPASSDIAFDMEIQVWSPQGGQPLFLTVDNPDIEIVDAMQVRAVSEALALDPDLHINEIMASNNGVVLDEYGQDGDWVEIFNGGDLPVDMAGLWLTDTLGVPGKWQVPEGYPAETTIAPGGYLVFFADGNPLAGVRHMDFKLSASGEALGLSYRSGESHVWLDSLSFGQQYPDISSGRWPDGASSWVLLDHTAGSSNIRRTVAIREVEELDFSLYPNPAGDHAFLRVTLAEGEYGGMTGITVLDLSGRPVLQREAPASGGILELRLDLGELDPGIYLVLIQNGTCRVSTRLIVTGR